MFREKKRRPKLPLRAYLMYITLLSFLLTGVTFSKYVTRSSASDSARVVKFGNVEITESGDFNSQGKMVIVPGVNLTKAATVHVSASEVDNFIFVKVDVTGFTPTDATCMSFTGVGGDISWSIDTAWTYLPSSGTNYVYYTYLDTNTTFAENIIANDRITVLASLTEQDLDTYCQENMIGIDFTAYMVQGGGFVDADSAWYAINH